MPVDLFLSLSLLVNLVLIFKVTSLARMISSHDFISADHQEEIETINREVNRVLHASEIQLTKQSLKIKKQNQMIGAFAVANSHLVRAPLARILGLVELLSGDFDLPSPEREVLLEKLKKSSTELDIIIQEVANMLRTKPNTMIKKYKMDELLKQSNQLVGESH